MPRIALVSPHFPPRKGVAVGRISAFCTYLRQLGWEVDVYTLAAGKGKNDGIFAVKCKSEKLFLEYRQDPYLKHKFKVGWNLLIKWMYGSVYKEWKKRILPVLMEQQLKNPYDVLLTSFSPLEAHLVGFEVKKKHPKLPWVLDMRDEMGDNPHVGPAMVKEYAYWEKQFSPFANGVLSVSKPLVDGFRTSLPDAQVYAEIRNGFEGTFVPSSTKREDFSLCYAGSFYGKRKPDSLMQALVNLSEAGKLPENWKFYFLATAKNFNIPAVLKSHCVFLPPIPNTEVLQFVSAMDCNVIISPPTPNKGAFTTKIFDYLAVKKPILGVMDVDDVAAELIKEAGCPFVVDFFDVPKIEDNLVEIISIWKGERKLDWNTEIIQSCKRENQVKKLDNILRDNFIQG